MAHKFDVKNKKRLDNEKRRTVMPPFQTLERLGVKAGNTVADIGCGTGYFTIPAAQIAGVSSKIYAMDISMEMLEEVEKKALEAGLVNICGVKTEEYDLKADSRSVDFVILSNVFHEIEDKGKFIAEISRILKNGGTLAIVEWEKVSGEFGPPVEERLSYEEVADVLSKNGYTGIERHGIAVDFYGITAKYQNDTQS